MTDYQDLVARLRKPKLWLYSNGYALNFESNNPFEAADAIEALMRERDEARAERNDYARKAWSEKADNDALRALLREAREALEYAREWFDCDIMIVNDAIDRIDAALKGGDGDE